MSRSPAPDALALIGIVDAVPIIAPDRCPTPQQAQSLLAVTLGAFGMILADSTYRPESTVFVEAAVSREVLHGSQSSAGSTPLDPAWVHAHS